MEKDGGSGNWGVCWVRPGWTQGQVGLVSGLEMNQAGFHAPVWRQNCFGNSPCLQHSPDHMRPTHTTEVSENIT